MMMLLVVGHLLEIKALLVVLVQHTARTPGVGFRKPRAAQ